MRLKDIDIAFFDLDGVLSVPRYETRLGVKCALPDEDWFESANWGSGLYKHCEPVPQVLKLLEQLKKRNTRLFVLTHETNSGAYFNKVDFVLKYYKDYFPSYREVLFTSKSEKKVDLMNILCSRYGISRKHCLLVEDTYNTCIQACNNDFQVLHISELLLNGGEFN